MEFQNNKFINNKRYIFNKKDKEKKKLRKIVKQKDEEGL